MESMNVFSDNFHKVIEHSVKSVLLEAEENQDNTAPLPEDWSSKNEKNLSCSYCRVTFTEAQQQREHYKLDWHRYNLKQSLLSKLPISEEEFGEKTGNDDLSSISGSDSEKEDTLDTFAISQGKIFLQNENGQVFCLYRCLLFDRKEEIPDTILAGRLKQCCQDNKQWTILMLGGGHFAGAIFDGDQPILHKTFHCYTVRAGQGGSQSSRDSKSGGSQPKSAGASLRRYNEQALAQHVKSIVDIWRAEIAKSSLIVYRASGPYNRSVLFGGSAPLLDRSDKRLRTIPFSTRRATFTEVKRVHSLLSQAQVYNSLDDAAQTFLKQKSPEQENKRNKIRSSCINRAKSRETIERPLPGKLSSSSSSEVDLTKLQLEENVDLETNYLEISFEGLEEFGDSLTPEQRKKGQKKKPKLSKTKKLKQQEEARKKQKIDVLVKGNLISLKKLLEDHLQLVCGEKEDTVVDRNEVKDAFINEVLDDSGNTLIHIAAMNEHDDVIRFLLENNANPCLKNKNQQTVYTCMQSKVIRDTLKEFAKENPEKYNYNKAQIPVTSLTDEESAEKRRALRRIKKEKEKEKKKENEIKRKEMVEQDRFLKLSDREKRALAAEKRILSVSGTVTSRCFLCASDMAGKVPFEYLGNRFCSIDCLKAHRLKGPVILS